MLHIRPSCSVSLLQEAGEVGGGEHGAAGTAAHFFRELTVGGVARPVDTLLMASLLLYCSQPFGQVASSSKRQLAFVFRVRCGKRRCRHTRLRSASARQQTLCVGNVSRLVFCPCRPFSCTLCKTSSPSKRSLTQFNRLGLVMPQSSSR